MKGPLTVLALTMLLAGQAAAQNPPLPNARPDAGPPPAMRGEDGRPPIGAPGERPWWRDYDVAQKLQLGDDQLQKIEKTALDHRLREIDLRAAVEKQDVLMHEQMEADTTDEAQLLAQVDKLSQARAELEKSRLDMFLAIRKVLTAEQAKNLRELLHRSPVAGPGCEPPMGPPPAAHGGPPA